MAQPSSGSYEAGAIFWPALVSLTVFAVALFLWSGVGAEGHSPMTTSLLLAGIVFVLLVSRIQGVTGRNRETIRKSQMERAALVNQIQTNKKLMGRGKEEFLAARLALSKVELKLSHLRSRPPTKENVKQEESLEFMIQKHEEKVKKAEGELEAVKKAFEEKRDAMEALKAGIDEANAKIEGLKRQEEEARKKSTGFVAPASAMIKG